jgi:hypothetical protein
MAPTIYKRPMALVTKAMVDKPAILDEPTGEHLTTSPRRSGNALARLTRAKQLQMLVAGARLERIFATAIDAIEAYNLAHYYLLPDGRCDGLSDAVAVIRAKYIEAITEDNLANTLDARDFEFLVAALYLMSGYKVEVTQQTRDGGHDVLATKEERGSIERILVECKCTRYA